MTKKRWIVNAKTETIHDAWGADERCNIDDIRHNKDVGTREMEVLWREGFKLCSWCFADTEE